MGDTYTKLDLFKIYIFNDIKDFNFKRIAHFLKIYFNNLIRKTPFTLMVETSNLCNFTCETCPTERSIINRPRAPMSFSTFKKVIDNSKDYIYKVLLHWTNEPLTNRNLDLFIRYCKMNKLFTEFSTNVALLNEEVSRRLLLAGLDKIELCFDGITRESFKAFRGSDSFEVVKNNIINFVKLRNELKANTYIEVQTIANKFNQHELPKIEEFVRKTGVDKLFVKTFGLVSTHYTDEERHKLMKKYLPDKAGVKRRYKDPASSVTTRPSCSNVKDSIPVTLDGRVTICCIDYTSKYYLGDLTKSKLPDLLRNPKAREIIKKGSNVNLPICRNCVMPDGS